MKIFVICSKAFYPHVPAYKRVLEEAGHEVFLPNSFDDPGAEARMKELSDAHHAEWKNGMLRHSMGVIRCSDAVLVVNEPKGGISGYIGGATFLEIYEAYRTYKIIYFLNPIPQDLIITDELNAMSPIILNRDLSLVKDPDELIEEVRKNIGVISVDGGSVLISDHGYFGDNIAEFKKVYKKQCQAMQHLAVWDNLPPDTHIPTREISDESLQEAGINPYDVRVFAEAIIGIDGNYVLTAVYEKSTRRIEGVDAPIIDHTLLRIEFEPYE